MIASSLHRGVGDREKFTSGGGSTCVMLISSEQGRCGSRNVFDMGQCKLRRKTVLISRVDFTVTFTSTASHRREIMNCTESSSEDDTACSSSDTDSMHSLSELSTPLSSLLPLSSGCGAEKSTVLALLWLLQSP